MGKVLDCTQWCVSKFASDDELRKFIAVRLLNYKWTKVGPDAQGNHAGEILTANGKLPENSDVLPKAGKVNELFLVPNWTGDIALARHLAARCGYSAIVLSSDVGDWARSICNAIAAEEHVAA